VMHTVPFVRRH